MVQGVPQHVDQGVANFFYYRSVYFGILAVYYEVDLLVDFQSQVSNHPGETVENGADGQHASFHNFFLKLVYHLDYVG